MISLLFAHYRVIQLTKFWWNYFLNNFSLFDVLLRRNWWCISISYHRPRERTFSDETSFSTTVSILISHGASINFFFWTTFTSYPFHQTLLLIKLISLSYLTLESSVTFSVWLLLEFLWMLYILVTVNVYHVANTLRITT